MIKQWHLKNFKSFRDLGPLDLAQINVLAGANSSGKSSLIQSILLLKQTLQYGAKNRSIALNGPLLRLGAFDDVLHFGATDKRLEIGFEFQFDDVEPGSAQAAPWVRVLRRTTLLTEAARLSRLVLELAYDAPSSNSELFGQISTPGSLSPDLLKSSLRIVRAAGPDLEAMSFATFTKRLERDSNEEEIGAAYSVSVDDESYREITADKQDASIRGGVLSYFLPSWIAVSYNSSAQHVINIVETIFGGAPRSSRSIALLAEQVVTPQVIAVVNDWLKSHRGEPIALGEGNVTAEGVRQALAPFLPRQRFPQRGGLLLRQTIQGDDHKPEELVKLKESVLLTMLSEVKPAYDLEPEIARNISAAADFVDEFLKNGVRYLGPLRDPPRPVYQLEALESTTDVGYRGEHTAAVLDINSATIVAYRRPPRSSLDGDYAALAEQQRASLHDAVVEWLVYLGVASDVVTTDAGVFGNRLQVSTDRLGRLHDLTNVGVGVSQVLPIVVMALLAPRGSLLIFEQHELHLHPKVQARLADFFIALALDGKQTLLETHSEYLVDRFRLRIALSETEAMRSLIRVLFSEKRDERSTLTPVEISEFGALLNWPKDFFEQSQRDVGRLIQAAANKRRAKVVGP